ncbi:sensor histidine kinase [Clostridiaceae bacterium]|nr:sensor histidine kinase [Clostridiaceae bacterium]
MEFWRRRGRQMGSVVKWYKNMAFRKKVLLSHLVVSLIPVVILGAFCYFQTRRLLIQREKEVLRETLEQNVLTLNSVVTTYQHVMENLVWDVNLKNALSMDYQNNLEMYRAYRDVIDPSVRQMKSLYPQMKQLSIYSSNPTLYPHGDILRKMEESDQFRDGVEDYKIHWKADESGVLELYCRIYEEGTRHQNIVYMELDYESVFGYLSGLFGDNYGVVIANGSTTPVYSYAVSQKEGDMPDCLTLSQLSCGAECLKDYVLEEWRVPANQWRVYLYRPLQTVSSSALSITFLIVIAVAVCLAIISAASVLLVRSVMLPLTRLIENIDQIAEENLTVNVQEESEDEIGHLIQSFSRMVERLNYMVNEVYKSKISQQEYEMKALQAQINPHFLYNSLSLINWKAIMADQTEISEMAQLLSTFYRTTLNKGKSIITIQGEWDNTCSYIRIQNIMHSGKFEVELRAEDSMMKYEMPNLILQPLVENAIGHGLDHKEGEGAKRLWVYGWEKEDCLEFEVGDNGCGMSREDVEAVLHTRSKGYGVQNVNMRLQLQYGKEFGLQIKSWPGEGTQILVRIPKVSPG